MSSDVASLDKIEASDWKPVTLGKIVRIVTDGITAADLSALPKVHHYSLPAFDVGAGPEIGPGETIKSNKTIVPDDCVLFSKLNPRIPRIWRVSGAAAPHSYCSTEFWPLVAQGRSVDLDYLTQYLGSYGFLGHPSITPASSTNSHQRVDRKAFERFEFLLPPLNEQQRVAEVLRSVDDAIASNQQCLTQAGSVRAALLQRHFHMAEWADGQPLPDGWEMPLLDAVATRGSGHTPNKKIDSYWNGGIKWVSLQDTKKLDQVYISTTAQQISDDGIRNSSAVLHPDGVVVISRDATVGRSAITVGPMAVSQHFIAYRCGKMLNNHYLYYWLQRMKPVFERIGAGSTIKTIGLPFFKSLRIALPPLEKQSQIADVMLDADKAMMSAAAAIQSLRKAKAVVMADLLSGHVRVPV